MKSWTLKRVLLTHLGRKSSFESEILHNNLAYYFVAEYNGHVVGYAGMWFVIDEGHITNIAIHPICRGKGWGEKLVR